MRKNGDGVGHTVLQSVLNGSATNQSQLTLNGIGYSLKLVLAILHGSSGEVVLKVPLLVLLFADLTHGDTKCTQTLAGKHLKVFSGSPAQLSLLASL